MIDCQAFYHCLKEAGIHFFCGVPDSLLQDILAYITDHTEPQQHIITANEGAAVALATGVHLATGEVPLVYMQNSGQGNALNPLASLTHKEVYSIPMILLIGWRGQPSQHDEPQHIKQGKINNELLDLMDIPFAILPQDISAANETVQQAIQQATSKQQPYAIVIEKNTFEKYRLQNSTQKEQPGLLKREEIIKTIVDITDPEHMIVSTTGKTSRELFECRANNHQGHQNDFLTVGSMGHASQIAMGLAVGQSKKKIICIDGDGALIMHMGSMATIGSHLTTNLIHVVINNGAHDSVGGQSTAGFSIDIPKIAQACGYKFTATAETLNEIQQSFNRCKETNGPSLLEIKSEKGARKDLGRPTSSPLENKNEFVSFLRTV